MSRSAERRLRAGHPWLEAERILEQSHEGRAGDVAVAFDRDRRFVAVGLYDPHSPIRMRALACRQPVTIDGAFFAHRIATSVARRAPLAATAGRPDGTDAYRLVHGESDELPGLVADRYADTLVLKLYSHAWIPHLRVCLDALLAAVPARRAVLRLGRKVAARADALEGHRDGELLLGTLPDAPLGFRENGLCFEVDPVRGQKTGFFLDQRDNRARVEPLAREGRVLNVFAYSGGFSLYAARGGAREVWSLDRSAHALASARRNFERNRALPAVAAARHETVRADAFAALADLARDREAFDVVVIDPPSFAARRAQVEAALGSYARLAHLGLQVLEPGGRIVLASCSHAVDPAAFRETVIAAARRAGRPLRELAEFGQPLDHPTDFAEGRYLKCLFAVA